MLNIGCHLSISKGFYKAGLEAVSIGANTFQYFTRNPRGGSAKEISIQDITKFQQLMKDHNFAPIFAHASYTMNLCSDNEDTRNFAKRILKDDIERIKLISNSYYIFHPGSHVGQGSEQGIQYVVDALNETLDADNDTVVLLEGMAGKGTEVGKSMEELKSIIDGVKHNKHVGICIDSCHLYSSGYDIVDNLDGVLDHIDKVVGLERVKAVHLNDSMMPYNSNKDRHEVIGGGTIGKEAIIRLINHPKLKHLTFNLETPNEIEGYKKEIEMLRSEYID